MRRLNMRRCVGAMVALAAVAAIVPVAPGGAHDAVLPRAPAVEGPESAALFERRPEFDYAPPRPGTYELPVLQPAADGSVLDATGTPRRLRDVLKGKIALVSFIYTLCGDATGCPLATATLHDIVHASARDPDLAGNLRLVSLSFDPERDTPPALAAYAAPLRADPGAGGKSEWTFLTTASERTLAPILAGYGQVVRKNRGTGGASDGTFAHVLRVYLIDRAGQVRNIYDVSFLDPRLIVADVKTLLLEERATTPR